MNETIEGKFGKGIKFKNLIFACAAGVLGIGATIADRVNAQDIHVGVQTLPAASDDYIDYSQTKEIQGTNGIRQGYVRGNFEFPVKVPALKMGINEKRVLAGQGFVKYGEGGLFRLPNSNIVIGKVDREKYMCQYTVNARVQVEYFENFMQLCRRANELQKERERRQPYYDRSLRSI